MARIRSIKPEFWTSEQVMELTRDARLCFIGLWNFCDDAGIHPANPKRLKAEVFPGDDHLTSTDVRRMIDECIANGLIEEYAVDGDRYWSVTGWFHQRIDQRTYKFPRPDGTIPEGAAKRRQSSKKPKEVSPRGVFAEHSPNARGLSGASPPNARAPIADQQASAPAASAENLPSSSPRDEHALNGYGPDDEMFGEHSANVRGVFAEHSPNARRVFAGCSPPDRDRDREGSKPSGKQEKELASPPRATREDSPPTPPVKEIKPNNRAAAISLLMRQNGVEGCNAANPVVIAWADNPRVTDDLLLTAAHKATGNGATRPGPKYLAPIVDELLNPKPAKVRDDWQRTDQGISRKAKELGVRARGGESYNDLKDRVFEALRRRDQPGAAA